MKGIYIAIIIIVLLIVCCCCSALIGVGIYMMTKEDDTTTDNQETTTTSKQETTTSEQETTGNTDTGEQEPSEYYINGTNLSIYNIDEKGTFTELKESIIYNGDIWISDANNTKFMGKYNDNYGLLFNGYIKVPTGSHEFVVGHDDGATMKIGDKEVDSWKATGYTEDLKINITADTDTYVSYEIKFFEISGEGKISLKMDGKRLPATLLYIKTTEKPSDSVVSTFSEYKHKGCYVDNGFRSIPNATDIGYDNTNYQKKVDAINECGNFAKAKGYKGFAVQDGGQCFTSEDAHLLYSKYGATTTCVNGKGGGYANDYYEWI